MTPSHDKQKQKQKHEKTGQKNNKNNGDILHVQQVKEHWMTQMIMMVDFSVKLQQVERERNEIRRQKFFLLFAFLFE